MNVEREKTRILIAAGGTGGHVFPGIAIAEALMKILPLADVVFAGTVNGPEAQLIPAEGWRLEFIGSSSIHAGGVLNRLKAMFKAFLALFISCRVLLKLRPRMVVGVGGFAAGPLVLLAALLRMPTAIVEPNAIAGRTNRMLGRFVKKAFVGFESAAQSFPKDRAVVTGNPVRNDVAQVERNMYDGSGPFTVLCYGGSQGAKHLNEAMMDAIQLLKDHADRVRIIHQVGKAHEVEDVAVVYRKAGFEAEVFTFSPRMAEFYREADVAIARAGAGTVAELAAVRLPAILVPYPYAVDDHQRANAEELVRAGGAIVMEDSTISGKMLAERLMDFMEHPDQLASMSDALGGVGKPDAAERIAEQCVGMILGKKEREHVQ